MRRESILVRTALLPLAVAIAVISAGAQGRPVARALGPVDQVRVAIGHGDITRARQLSEALPAGAQRELSTALVEIFEGRDAAAATRLAPLAAQAPLGDAALELGLLELRVGKRIQGRNRLDAIASVRSFAGAQDYIRLARAARGLREYLLANDAYQRVADEPSADVQTGWGDMFLERHQPGDAVKSYRRALEIDAAWLPARLGLARALADDAPAEASEMIEATQQQAPDYPDAWSFLAERHLDGDDVDAARTAIDRLASAKPNTIEEIALRAAVAFKTGGLTAVDVVADRARALNPSSSLAYRMAAEQAARQYRFADAAVLAQKAVAIDPEDPASSFNLGLAQLRAGDEAAARAALEASWELDKSAPVTKNLLDLLDHLETFTPVLHGEFIFKFAREEAEVLKAYALPLADEAYETFRARYGFTPTGPILVEVFPRHDDFAVRTLGLPGLVGALGACFGRVVTMDSPRARPPGDFSWQATLWHELAHVFTLQLSDFRVPRWLTEGISVYEEHRRQPAWGRELTLQYAQELAKGKTFGVKRLPEAFKHPQSLSMAYFEASLVVEHLVAVNGDEGLRQLLRAYAAGDDDTAAFAKAFGKSIDDVEASFTIFINTRYGALRNAMQDPARPVDSADLPALRARAAAAPGNYISQWTLGLGLFKAGDLAGARAPLERAAALAPEASGANSPRAMLAEIAEQDGDRARARRELRALLTHDHVNVTAARRLASLAAEDQVADDENFALRLVADLDPFDADTHGFLGRRLLASRDYAEALVEFQAALALGPANKAEAHADIAETLLNLGRADAARREALLALEAAPTFARAQDLLLKAMGD